MLDSIKQMAAYRGINQTQMIEIMLNYALLAKQGVCRHRAAEEAQSALCPECGKDTKAPQHEIF